MEDSGAKVGRGRREERRYYRNAHAEGIKTRPCNVDKLQTSPCSSLAAPNPAYSRLSSEEFDPIISPPSITHIRSRRGVLPHPFSRFAARRGWPRSCGRGSGAWIEFLDCMERSKTHERVGVPRGPGTDSDDGFDLGWMKRSMDRLGDPHERCKFGLGQQNHSSSFVSSISSSTVLFSSLSSSPSSSLSSSSLSASSASTSTSSPSSITFASFPFLICLLLILYVRPLY
ncbi:Mur ligase middle domain [Musa troglodytarum]|uniref:Mur ligase middle domain n=1 Tax=Musa troglodytarum TaxID=320322 RepID=A0A9E7END8_9LILI|nr:Mur ligase middle domain [Musa troglodytarum]